MLHNNLDPDVAEVAVQFAHQPLHPDQPGRAQREVGEPDQIAAGQGAHPVGELGQRAGGEHAADQRSHRSAGDSDHLVTAGVQLLDHPDVGEAARPAGAEHEVDLHASSEARGTHR